jgi:hypothetical protein
VVVLILLLLNPAGATLVQRSPSATAAAISGTGSSLTRNLDDVFIFLFSVDQMTRNGDDSHQLHVCVILTVLDVAVTGVVVPPLAPLPMSTWLHLTARTGTALARPLHAAI